MCGRYTLTKNIHSLEERFAFRSDGLLYSPRDQVYPTEGVLTVVRTEESRSGGLNRAKEMRWGWAPSWTKRGAITNAQAEKVSTSNVWRPSLMQRRCLIPADGFFEWRREPYGGKTMLRFKLASQEPFAFAGLWAVFEDSRGEQVPCCAIITTIPNALMEPIHTRMPVILSPEREALWLDRSLDEPDLLSSLLGPCPAEEMQAFECAPLR